MKKRIRKSLALMMTAALLFTLTACGSSSSSAGTSGQAGGGTTAATEAEKKETETTVKPEGTQAETSGSGEAKEGYNLAIILGSAEMPFTQVLLQGAQSKIRPEDNLSVYYCDWDASKEIQLVEDICANKVDAIMLDPADPDAILPALQTAKDAGIPVISYDCSTNYPDYLAVQISSDDVEAGYLIGKELFEALGGKGVIQSYVTNTTKNSQNRLVGLEKALEEYPDIEWVYNCQEKFDPESAVKVFESMLLSHPDTDAFFCANENIVQAAATVLEANGMIGDVLLGNVGAGTVIKDYLNEGKIYCSYDSQPYVMGQMTVDICYDILDNETKYDANEPLFVPGEIRKKGDDYFAG